MAYHLRWYESDGITPIAGPLTFSALVPSVLSAWQVVRLYNDHDLDQSADDAIGQSIRALSRTTSGTDFYASGHPLVDRNAIRVQVLGGTAPGAVEGAERTLGANSTLPIVTIAAGQYIELRVAVRLPPGSTLTSAQVALALDDARAFAAGEAALCARQGIALGLGISSSSLLVRPFTMTAEVVPSDTVVFGDLLAVVAGRPCAILEHDEVFTDEDVASATLAVGESYGVRVTVSPEGVLTLTKGAKAAQPLLPASIPSVPDGHFDLGFLEVPEGLAIDDSMISVTAIASAFVYLGATGLNVTVGRGNALLGSSYVRNAGSLAEEVTASDDTSLWLLSDGSSAVARPSAGVDAQVLYDFTADATNVTAVVDRRRFAEGERMFEATLGGAEDDAAYFPIPVTGPDLALHPERCISAVLIDSDPSALSGGSGRWVVEIEVRPRGGTTWTSIFPSSGTDDRRPALGFDATDPEFSEAFPETRVIPRGSTVRYRVHEVPPGGTPTTGISVSIVACEV